MDNDPDHPEYAPDAFLLPETIVTGDYEITEGVEFRRERYNQSDPVPEKPAINSDGRVYHLVYCLPKPMTGGQTVLYLTPLKFLDKLAGLIAPPRKHRDR